MSLNHRRRIFRATAVSMPLRGAILRRRGAALLVLASVAVLSAGIWLLGHPSEAPATAPEAGRLSAPGAQVAVLDGGTLRLQDRVVRLDDVDAPSRGKNCRGADDPGFDCGAATANALAALVRDAQVDCAWQGRDPAGRPLAVCVARGLEVNQALVADGWARAGASRAALVTAEAQARAAHRGLWAGNGTADW